MSLTTNFVLPKSNYLLLKKPKTLTNDTKTTTTTISCRTKEKNLYQVLSVESQNVSFHELKRAYRAKARKLHPDVSPPSKKDECTKLFVELHEAYEVLSDPQSRRMYDLSLVGDCVFDEQRVNFSRMVWEMQLDGLKQRSASRPKRRNIRFV